jgi:hypothetical protein
MVNDIDISFKARLDCLVFKKPKQHMCMLHQNLCILCLFVYPTLQTSRIGSQISAINIAITAKIINSEQT